MRRRRLKLNKATLDALEGGLAGRFFTVVFLQISPEVVPADAEDSRQAYIVRNRYQKWINSPPKKQVSANKQPLLVWNSPLQYICFK